MSLPDKAWNFVAGELLLIDKPLDWTSFDVVRRIRSLFHIRKVGHAGTLDPKATGLLIVCTGAMTKRIGEFMDAEKEYTGTFRLGIRTPSFDTETQPSETRAWEHVSTEQIEASARSLTGKLLQTPPMYSAAKVGGMPLYRYARKGRTIERAAKDITVSEFVVTAPQLPDVQFLIRCSKGTYIRSLVDELGQNLGCGATLMSLRRSRIGSMSVDEAMSMTELMALGAKLGMTGTKQHADSTTTA